MQTGIATRAAACRVVGEHGVPVGCVRAIVVLEHFMVRAPFKASRHVPVSRSRAAAPAAA